MSSRRRVYKQGNSVVVSIPMYLIRRLGAEARDRFLINPISPEALMFELHSREESPSIANLKAIEMKSAICRTLYKQGNAMVVTIPEYIREMVNLQIGDYLILTIIADRLMTGTRKSYAQAKFEDSQNYNQFPRNDAVPR